MIDSLDILRTDEFVEHHGVKGMKWGVRKARAIQKDLNRLEKEYKNEAYNYANAVLRENTYRNRVKKLVAKNTDATGTARIKGKQLKKLIKLTNWGKQQSDRIDSSHAKIKDIESRTWKLLGEAGAAGYTVDQIKKRKVYEPAKKQLQRFQFGLLQLPLDALAIKTGGDDTPQRIEYNKWKVKKGNGKAWIPAQS